MLKRLLLAVLLLAPTPVFAAISSLGGLGVASSIDSGTTLVITTSATMEQHNVALIRIGVNNNAATNGDNSEVSSVTDSASNTYTKICEYTYADGGAANGATVSNWVGRAVAQLASGGTITVTFANTVTARAVQAQEFDVTDGNILQIAGTCKTENLNDGADAGSLVIDSLASKEYLFQRSMAWESTDGVLTANTASYTNNTIARINTSVEATSMTTAGERFITTATGSTSDPTMTAFATDGASIFFALEECTPGVNCTGDAVTRRPISPMFMQ